MATDNPPAPATSDIHPHQVEHLKTKREHLVKKIERVKALPKHRDHDHDQALKRCRDGVAEIDREIKDSK